MNYILIIIIIIILLFLFLYRSDITKELSNINNINLNKDNDNNDNSSNKTNNDLNHKDVKSINVKEIKFHNYLLYYNKALQIYNETPIIDMASKGETITRHAIESLLLAATNQRYVFEKIRHEEIINPKTNRSLELDCFNKELKLAIEYNGEQHYLLNSYFHKSDNDYNEQLYRDQIKRQRCKELGITLIEVPHLIKHKDILLFICIKLNEYPLSSF